MAIKKRRTRRTDANGNVLDEYKAAFNLQAIDAARRAGIPANLLDPAGWDGDPNDITGYFADCIHTLGDCLSRVERDMAKVAEPIGLMEAICDRYGIGRRAAIPYQAAAFLRDMKNHGEWLAAGCKGRNSATPDNDDWYQEGVW